MVLVFLAFSYQSTITFRIVIQSINNDDNINDIINNYDINKYNTVTYLKLFILFNKEYTNKNNNI